MFSIKSTLYGIEYAIPVIYINETLIEQEIPNIILEATNDDVKLDLFGISGSMRFVANIFLGSELVTNGDMELDSNWADAGTPTTNERSNEQAHGGTYSRKFVVDSQYDGIQLTPFFSIVQGNTYKVTASFYGNGNNKAFMRAHDATNAISYYSTLSVNAGGYLYPSGWTTETWYFVALDTSAQVTFYSQCGTGVTTGTFYVDDVSIKEVIGPIEYNAPFDGSDFSSAKTGSFYITITEVLATGIYRGYLINYMDIIGACGYGVSGNIQAGNRSRFIVGSPVVLQIQSLPTDWRSEAALMSQQYTVNTITRP